MRPRTSSHRSIVWIAVVVQLATAGVAAAEDPSGKRIAVAEFDAADAPRARMAVLETLSEHTDVEIVALGDIEVAGKRLAADPKDPAGRRKLSSELGIDAWLDGTIEDDHAQFTLQAPDGRVLARTSLNGHKASVAAGLAGQKIWSAMGPLLSPHERDKRALEAQGELAQKKIQAREQELVRLRQVVEQRAAQRVAALQAAQKLAREKRAAFAAELDRQRGVVDERLALAKREREAAERRQADEERKKTEAEEAEFLASLQESDGPPAWSGEPSAPSPAASPGVSVWGVPSASAVPSRTPPRPAPEPVAVSRSGRPSTTGLSPATQRWLAEQGGAAQLASQPAYVQPPPKAAAASAVNSDGLSPATRRWLEQQQQAR